jgi:hypothetical protein
MRQVARNLTDVGDDFLLGSRYLIMDRDTKYTTDFRGHLDREGVKPVRCPARAPDCSAFAERFVRSIKNEYLDRVIFLARCLFAGHSENMLHYHIERNHQGVGNRLLKPLAMVSSIDEPVHRRERPGENSTFAQLLTRHLLDAADF